MWSFFFVCLNHHDRIEVAIKEKKAVRKKYAKNQVWINYIWLFSSLWLVKAFAKLSRGKKGFFSLLKTENNSGALFRVAWISWNVEIGTRMKKGLIFTFDVRSCDTEIPNVHSKLVFDRRHCETSNPCNWIIKWTNATKKTKRKKN